MLSKIFSAGVTGVDAYRVEVEVDVARALPSFSIVGLPDGAVKESRDRVRAAMKNSGFAFPQTRVTVNLAPADIKKEGAGFDLPVALAVLVADGGLKNIDLSETCFVGELALDGAVRPVRGVLAMAARASRMGIRRMVVPRANAMEAAVVEGLDVAVADSLGQLVEMLETAGLPCVRVDTEGMLAEARDNPDVDFSEVRGQAHAKRALEIAAAGGHNILMLYIVL